MISITIVKVSNTKIDEILYFNKLHNSHHHHQNTHSIGCIQATNHGVSSCTFCPKDGVCHTVGSLLNKCSNDECISVCRTSSCKKDDISYCDDLDKGNISWMIE